VWELAAAGKAAVLVPYPFGTGDHQTKNAQYFRAAGGAILVPDSELGQVPEIIRSLLGDPRRLAELSEAMLRVARPNAADEIAELVERRPSIVVGGAHGKTTTAGMIAFCLDRLGLDPAFLIGGEIPQLGGNARAGEGWLVAEGDESDRSLELLRPRVAVLTNVELDHHATYASEEEVRELFERWLHSAPAR